MTAFHRWLIRQRIYCEHNQCGLTRATHVVKINGRDEVRCDQHAQRLKAARKSDQLQDLSLTETQTPNPTT